MYAISLGLHNYLHHNLHKSSHKGHDSIHVFEMTKGQVSVLQFTRI